MRQFHLVCSWVRWPTNRTWKTPAAWLPEVLLCRNSKPESWVQASRESTNCHFLNNDQINNIEPTLTDDSDERDIVSSTRTPLHKSSSAKTPKAATDTRPRETQPKQRDSPSIRPKTASSVRSTSFFDATKLLIYKFKYVNNIYISEKCFFFLYINI